MSELGHEVGRYVDTIAPPITIEAIRAMAPVGPIEEPFAPPPPDPDDRSRRGLRVLAIAAALVLVVGTAVALRVRSQDENVRVEPGIQIQPRLDAWLTPFGPEVEAPAVPAGWTVMDVRNVRFAVPSDWSVPISRSCQVRGEGGPTAGLVLLPEAPGTGPYCGPEPALPPSILTFDTSPAAHDDGPAATIGTLPATLLPPLVSSWSTCAEPCPLTYRLADGLTVTVTGPDADAVLATFTDSGSRRALQEGPIADRSGWQSVSFEGVELAVPADWTFLDLPGSWTHTTTADGGSRSSGQLAPGSCAQPMFRQEGQVTVGEMTGQPSCPAPMRFDIAPGNGAWIRPIAEARAAEAGDVATAGSIGGLDVSILGDRSPLQQDPNPTVDAIIRTGSGSYQLTIGTSDPSVVRSILRSLHAA